MTLASRYWNQLRGMFFLVVLAFVALWGVWRFTESSAGDREAGTAVIDWPVENAELLVLERDDVRIECRRDREGVWHMVSPIEARADAARIHRILDAAAAVRVVDRISSEAVRRRDLSLQDFGLLRPRARLLVADAWRRFELLLGNDLPVGEEVYAAEPEKADVLVLPRSLMKDWPASVPELRDRALLGGRAEDVTRVEILVPGAPFVRLSREESGWRMLQPVRAPASGDRVEALLKRLFEARVKKFVWPRADAESAVSLRERLVGVGLDRDDAGIRLRLRSFGGRESEELRFGLPDQESPGEVFAYWSADDAIVTVSEALPSMAKAPFDAWRDPHLLDFDIEEVEAFEIRRPGVFLRAEKTPGTGRWHLRAPANHPADPRAIENFLAMLKEVRTLEVAEIESGMAAPPENIPLSILVKTGAGEIRTHFYESEKSGERLAVTTGEELVSRVRADAKALEFARQCDAADFHDRTVLALPIDDVWRLSVGADGETVVVERDAGGNWISPRGDARRLDAEALVDILLLGANLKAEGVETLEASGDLARYGLNPPRAVLTFDLRGGEALSKTLLVGAAGVPREYFAMVRGHDVVYRLAPEPAERLVTLPVKERE